MDLLNKAKSRAARLMDPLISLFSTPMAEASSPAAPTASNASKRLREDGEVIKNRLLDQHFHITRYADPLVPRKTSDPEFWPRDVTPEMEQKWLAIIKEHQSG